MATKKIAVLTSGGDAQGMNAAVQAVVVPCIGEKGCRSLPFMRVTRG
jgi:6-phosphofructokinase